MYFINWEREISKIRIGDRLVVIKKNKSFKQFRELVLIFCFILISICSGNPCTPPQIGKKVIENEGFEARKKLKLIGIRTPELISISKNEIIEEYIECGNLYSFFLYKKSNDLAYRAGVITGLLHRSGYVFTDNKCQNFLVSKKREVIRVDLGFIQLNNSLFAQSMDIGSFLASILDLESSRYNELEREFLLGYIQMTKKSVPYLSIILRNILALGFVYDHYKMIKNLINKSNI